MRAEASTGAFESTAPFDSEEMTLAAGKTQEEIDLWVTSNSKEPKKELMPPGQIPRW